MSFSIKDAIVTDIQIIANEFNNLFVSIGPKLVHDLSSDVNPLSYVNNVVNSIVPTITTLEVMNIISSTKHSSPGWDHIPAVMANKCILIAYKPVNSSIKECVFPSELKLDRVVPLFKSGDSSQITNYRPISILLLYYRFIIHFPIWLDFLFITFLLHFLLSWTSSLSISSSAISASTLSNHVFLGLPTSLLPSTLYSIHFFTQSFHLSSSHVHTISV